MATFSCPHMVFSLFMDTPGVSSSYKDTSRISLGPHLYDPLNFKYPFKGSTSKYSHTEDYGFNIQSRGKTTPGLSNWKNEVAI